MSRTKIFKAAVFILASAVMGACLWFVPEASGAVSVVYITALSVYLGLDIAGMIAKTAALPKGKYKSFNIHKYVVAAFCLLVLIGTCTAARHFENPPDISTAMTSFLSAVMILFTCILGGLEGNKIATGVPMKEETSKAKGKAAGTKEAPEKDK